MSIIRSALLYTALVLGANAAMADMAAVDALRTGDMRKLSFHATPKAAGEAAFQDREGGEHRLAAFRGRVTLVNFWAVWCAPCRTEMPALDRLQAELGGDDFTVVPIAVGYNRLPAIDALFAEIGVTHLPVYLDPSQALAREMGVLGKPVTVILNREGREVARMVGDAEWDSDSAKAILRALMSESDTPER